MTDTTNTAPPWIAGPLQRTLASSHAHALLIHGPSGVGQFELALALAAAWLCEGAAVPLGERPCGACASCRLIAARSHPDLVVLVPDALREALGWNAAGGAGEEGGEGSKKKPSKDIRVEAVLYAQTRSFFVIPGDWFNMRPDDTLDKYTAGLTRPDGLPSPGPSPTTAQAQAQNDRARFPFYGQPIDMKIIIDGSVSEAQPSDVANQTAWMLKWGWIPQFHGSAASTPGATTAEPSGHQLIAGNAPANKPAIGLQIIYNPQAGYPYNPGDGTPAKPGYYLRSDAYGRPLPFTPKLPVSTALLFAGQSSEPPLLQ